MRRFAFAVLVVAACSSKSATHEQAAAACEHQVELGYWKGFDESVKSQGKDPKDLHAQGETALAEQKKSDAWKQHVDKCATRFEQATAAQADCVIKASTTDEATACLVGK